MRPKASATTGKFFPIVTAGVKESKSGGGDPRKNKDSERVDDGNETAGKLHLLRRRKRVSKRSIGKKT